MGGLIARIKFDRILTIFLIQFYSNVIHLRYIKSFTMSQQLIFINNNLAKTTVQEVIKPELTKEDLKPSKPLIKDKSKKNVKPDVQEDAPAVKNSFTEEE